MFITESFINALRNTYPNVSGEQDTKNKLIEPFFGLLGYDINCSDDIQTEYTGKQVKNHDRADYVLCIAGKPKIIVEAKDWHTKLGKAQVNQLYKYFCTSDCKIAILTNGIHYWFYSDFERENIMDHRPFHTMNILSPNKSDEALLTAICKVQQCTYDVNKYIIERKVERLLNDKEKLAHIITSSYFKEKDYDAVLNGIDRVI